MIIAFIPVRGGSKSIPLKNIKPINGKPLIYWSIAALQNVTCVDEIIVATDSEEITKTVMNFNFSKVKIYRRKAENAADTSTTESVMLEYIEQSNLQKDDIFMLVQATSPLTQTKHFEEALGLYMENKYDSLLSCVRNYRFFWNEDGTGKNYDYRKRPRRQDFDGQLMENGAFYINTIGGIKKYQNRLCGKIGIYEMPEYTATEIDEPTDWIIVENIMKKYVYTKPEKAKIKLLLSDIDGVLTDCRMYYSETGDEMKKFNFRDGVAFAMLKDAGIKTGFITTETTKIAEKRAKKLNIDFLEQGRKFDGKLKAAKEICKKTGISLTETAYVGDDINCKELLENVGFAFCPSDAVEKIKDIANIHIVNCRGGDGVIREIVENYLEI